MYKNQGAISRYVNRRLKNRQADFEELFDVELGRYCTEIGIGRVNHLSEMLINDKRKQTTI